jgi:hypothetical protein
MVERLGFRVFACADKPSGIGFFVASMGAHSPLVVRGAIGVMTGRVPLTFSACRLPPRAGFGLALGYN